MPTNLPINAALHFRDGSRRQHDRRAFSPVRSVGWAAAIAGHAVLLGLMAVPLAPPAFQPEAEILTTPIFDSPRPPPPILPPPEVRPVVRRSVPATAPATHMRREIETPVLGLTQDTPSPLDPPSVDLGSALDVEPVWNPPAIASLRLLQSSAPRYPRVALMRRLQGEVELLILVGIDGRPESVSVSRSSGHALLDRAAVEHVLRRWVFEPAERLGVPVPAYARVPVRFTLPE